MHYTLHQLQVFLTIVECKSITKAASTLSLTQPAVSIQLKNLQDQFDIRLTEQVGKQIYITDFGLEIAAMAGRILNEVSAINFKTEQYKGVLTGRLKLAIVSTGKYIMPYFLSGFLKKHQGIDLMMDVTNKSKVLQSLESNEVDLALVSVLPEKMPIEEELLLTNQLYLTGTVGENFDKGPYPKTILNQLPLIYREKGSATRAAMEKFMAKSGVKARKTMELTSNEAVKQAIMAGLGYSIMPLIGIHHELITGRMQIIPVSGLPIYTNWRIIWLKNKHLSPVANMYLEHIKLHKKEICENSFGWITDF